MMRVLLCLVILLIANVNVVVAKEKLVVAFSELVPWKVINKGKFTGAYAELAREVAKELSLNIEFEACPLKRCLHLMEKGAADLIIGVNHTRDRQQYIQFLTTPYRCSTSKVFYVRTNEHRRLIVYDDLYNFEHIGVKRGARYFTKFDVDNYLPKDPVLKNRQNFYKLINKRINTLIINEAQGAFLVDALGIREQVAKAAFFYKDDSLRYIGISKHSSHFDDFQRFEAAMLKISESGKLEQIMNDFLYKPYQLIATKFNCR